VLDKQNKSVDWLLKSLDLGSDAGGLTAMGWTIRAILRHDAGNDADALADVRNHGRQGIRDLFRYVTDQPQSVDSTPEAFVLGYEPSLASKLPPDQQKRLDAWYGGVGTLFKWLVVSEGNDLTIEEVRMFADDVGTAITDLAPVIVSSQLSHQRLREKQ